MSPNNELDAYIQEHLNQLFPGEINGERLVYHYTTVDTFEVLTRENADFVCTYCGALNDKAEFSTGIELLGRYFKQHPHASCGLSMETLKSMAEVPAFGSWSMSFSSVGDSLSQWISYTDRHDGGVSLGFSIDDLWHRIRQLKRSAQLLYLVPCLYASVHEEEIDCLVRFLFGPYREALRKQCKRRGCFVDESQSLAMITLSIALVFASMVKDESFREEKEWRIVMQPFDEAIVRGCEFLGGKPRLYTHLFGKGFQVTQSIRDVVCSPHGMVNGKVQMIANLRKLTVKPRASKSTYIS